jgi:hypothetical protein
VKGVAKTKRLTTIAIRPETRDLLRRFGRKGEDYDTILTRILENRVLELVLPRCPPKPEEIGSLEEEGYVLLEELRERLGI